MKTKKAIYWLATIMLLIGLLLMLLPHATHEKIGLKDQTHINHVISGIIIIIIALIILIKNQGARISFRAKKQAR